MPHQTDMFALLDPPRWIAGVAPDVHRGQLARLEAEGRSPFGQEPPDQAAVQSIADETMLSLVWDLAQIIILQDRRAAGADSFKTKRHWTEFQKAYPQMRHFHVRAYQETLDAVQDVWGWNGRAAFDHEARRRAGWPGGDVGTVPS